jgi:preprotein translocase subunit SecY
MIGALGNKLPSIAEPKTYLNFKTRLKWTVGILILFLVLGQVTVYGISPQATERFRFLEIILGSTMGSLISLGIGPIVTASIILQLLVGSGLVGWDLKTKEGKANFQGAQKLLAVVFCVFEGFAFVMFGAIQPINQEPFTLLILIAQLTFGGILILLMDEVVSKWGIGSGVSLFIAAGVGKNVFIRALNPLITPGSNVPSGYIPLSISLLAVGEVTQALLAWLPILSTVLVFMIVVYVQAIKVEVPLAFGSIRGFSRRWPLKFIYTSNIPVILTAALLANLRLVGSFLYARGITLLGSVNEQGIPTSGILYYITAPNSADVQVLSIIILTAMFVGSFLAFYFGHKRGIQIVLISTIVGIVSSIFITNAFVGLPSLTNMLRVVGYFLFMIVFSVIFSVFWISTSGMDAESVAEQISSLGMQIPGFRRDPRIVKQVLNRYIPVLAVLGGMFVGALAAVADLTNALGTGTGILLTVMIIYQLYEQISTQYVEDMNPAMRKFFE